MSYDNFIEQVRKRTGGSRDVVEQTVVATLQVLGERLRHVDAEAVASELPEPLARHLRGGDSVSNFDIEHFFARITARERREQAVEYSLAICQVLAENIGEQARTHLRMQPLLQLFVPRRSIDEGCQSTKNGPVIS